jgi:pilus assembly protein Flp/PilA
VTKLLQRLRRNRTKDEGASAVEYGLLVALIAVFIAGTVVLLGTALQSKFTEATCKVANGADTDADCTAD